MKTEEQLEKDRRRRLAHYHANKNTPEYRANRLEKTRAWQAANKEKLKAYRLRYQSKIINNLGIDTHRLNMAKKRAKRVSEWRKKDPEGWKIYVKARNIKTKYKISVEEYNEIFKLQNNKCAICNLPFTEKNNKPTLDHCHKTGKVRGMLHMKCNAALGMIKDDIEIARQMVDYLEKHK